MKLLVIGGVAAGMSAASKLKRITSDAQVIVYEKGNFLSYGACGLPYYISGENNDHQRMIARSKEHYDAMGIHVSLQHEVLKIDFEKKQVLVKNLQNGDVFIDNYDKLMISTGATAIIPKIKGVSLRQIHILKTLEDGMELKEVADLPNIENVVVVGGGYIGIEVAEAMRNLGKNVRIIEQAERILPTLDKELTEIAEEELVNNQIRLHVNESVQAFIGNDQVEFVQTNQGTYEADLVILSVGVMPATKLFRDTTLSLADNGAIIVDREMRTNISDVYAAGDCAQIYHKVMEENTFIPLGTNANKGGRLAGINISGQHAKYTGTLGSAAIKIFNLEAARTGLSEKDAKNLAIDYTTVFVETADHPGYYPNQMPIWIKLICEKRSRIILGAQAIGPKGVVLRIDVFAVAIHNKMTADDLGMTDLCYAPPFAGVWDAIHIASNAVK